MVERVSFRLTKDSYKAYALLKQWCRANRVPMGRILNSTIQAMGNLGGLVNYNEVGQPKHCVIDIKYPKQTNIEDRLRYLTRVKNNNSND